MNSIRKIPLALKILLPGLGIVYLVAVAKPEPEPAPKIVSPIEIIEVTTVALAKTQQSVPLHTQGTVTPIYRTELIAEVSGKINEVAKIFSDGGSFMAGEILITLDDADYRLAVPAAQAELADARMQLAMQEAQAKEAYKQWQDLGSNTANELFKRQPQLAMAQAKVAAAQAQLDKAKLNVMRTKISLPFSGRIESISVGVGQFVGAGSPLAKVFDSSRLQVKLPLTEQQVGLMDLHAPASVTLEAHYGGKLHQWHASISRMGASIDENTRTLDAIAEIASEQQVSQFGLPLMVGLFVNARITSKPLPDVISLPQNALFKRDQLYIIDEHNQVAVHQVQPIGRDKNSVWIQSDELLNGQLVITNKLGFLAPGNSVKPQQVALMKDGHHE